jgi:antitoxin component of RelBE/YafQ-DinJ toxin-antitoxin module
MAEEIRILGIITDEKGGRIPFTSIEVTLDGRFFQSTISKEDGYYMLPFPGTTDVSKLSITFNNEDYLIENKTNLQKTGQSLTEVENNIIDLYQVNITLKSKNVDLSEQQADLQIQTQALENVEIEVSSFIKQPNEIKFATVLNKLKENLKRTLFPFILSLLLPFGVRFVQSLLDKLPNPQPDACPDENKIKGIIKKRNQLVKQLNQIYNIIRVLSKILNITNIVIQSLKIGINIAKALPTPPFAPSGGIASALNKIELRLEVAGIAVTVLSITSAVIGVVLQTIINLLNNLDLAIQQCSEEQNIPFEELNDELNALANQTIEETQNNNNLDQSQSYKGFTFEIKLDEINTSKYPKRYAQALNIQGVPVLRSESSFASNPQVLIDQLKFIIDTQNLRGD